jgi:hypothetical protein
LGQLGAAQPNRLGSTRPKKKKETICGQSPVDPIYYGSRVCLAKHIAFSLLFNLSIYLVKHAFLDIRKFQKKIVDLLNLFVGPSFF